MGARPSKASAPATPPPPEANSCSSSWAELPPELAGLVLRRLPSLADRVRFGSVCRHWRHAARQQAPALPPVLPWTITSYTGKVQTIPDGEVHRLCSGKLARCECSSEKWLMMIGRASPDDTEIRNFLENPLSGAILPMPNRGSLRSPGGALHCITKFIVCRDSLIVAITIDPTTPYRGPLIACCRPGGTSSWSTSTQAAGGRSCYQDIAFQDPSIYAIAETGDLFEHEVSDDHGLGVQVSFGKLMIEGGDTRCFGVSRFLVVSLSGRLLMVKWNHRHGIDYDDDISAFEVFEADLQMSRWSRLWSIGDQVLFVSQRCSKAVPISLNHGDYLRGNCIYFVDNAIYGPQKCCFGSTSCGMYDLRNNTYHPTVSDAFRANEIAAAAWFFPHS